MRNRKPSSPRRNRRQRFLLQLLASVSLGVGTARAQDNERAHYTADPNQPRQVITVGGPQPPLDHSVRQVQAIREAVPLSDAAVASSSDVPSDDLLAEPEPANQTGPANANSSQQDLDAIVDEATLPAPVQRPPSEAAINAMAAPSVPPRRRGRPLGAVAGSNSVAPSMIGDFFGGNLSVGSSSRYTVALAGGDRRFKIAENSSPIPQDRVFFNYNHFHNALRDVNGESQNLDRFTFGLERTFLDGLGSIEVRLPFASALDSTQSFGAVDPLSSEVGNLATTLKFDMLSGSDWVLASGMSMIFPTGDDYVLASNGRPLLVVQNESYHLAPFLAMLTTCDDWFAQGFVQTDFDLTGYDVFTDNGGFEGVLQDQNLLFIDVSAGHWLLCDRGPHAYLCGVAAMAELHYATTMNDTDAVAGVFNEFNRMDVLNATAALHFQFRKTAMRIGAAAPLRGDEENLFDAEIILQLNHNY